MRQIAKEWQVELPPLDDDLSVYEIGFDSMAFAVLVARLEEDHGVNPFSDSGADFPLTFGDFVQAYEMSASGVLRTS
jgi:hypothetical protein